MKGIRYHTQGVVVDNIQETNTPWEGAGAGGMVVVLPTYSVQTSLPTWALKPCGRQYRSLVSTETSTIWTAERAITNETCDGSPVSPHCVPQSIVRCEINHSCWNSHDPAVWWRTLCRLTGLKGASYAGKARH